MNAEIIAVGSELLLGQIVNTNARFLSQQLAGLGINVYYHTVVGDNPLRLKSAIEVAEQRADFIIFTGGLGPTKDDLTKETIARHLGKKLVMDEDALSSIQDYFMRTNRLMTENNKKQALVLEDSTILKNDHGMAPGMIVKTDSYTYMLLPGPPKEMEPMFLTYAHPLLLNNDGKLFSRVLRFFGIGEAMLETEIEDLIDGQSNPTIAPLAADGEVTLRITAKHSNEVEAMKLISATEEKIMLRVGDYFYGYDDTSLIHEVASTLLDKNITISCAESLTGGQFQQQLSMISGASQWFKGGIVCYSNEVKENILRVTKETIDVHGVISELCAKELAENVRTLLNTDIGISFTGVAGPNSMEGHPVGTVFIGIAIKGQLTVVKKLQLSGSREAIRTRSVKYGAQTILKALLK